MFMNVQMEQRKTSSSSTSSAQEAVLILPRNILAFLLNRLKPSCKLNSLDSLRLTVDSSSSLNFPITEPTKER